MNDAAVRELARRAGIAVRWTDYADKRRRVPLDTMRRILTALGLPCDTEDDLSHSRRLLDGAQTPPLITTTAGHAVDLPIRAAGDPPRARLIDERGAVAEVEVRRTVGGVSLPGIKAIGYHTIEIGQTRLKLAVAPPRCVTIEDIAPGERVAGLAAQMNGLRSAGDCGIGDMAGVGALAKSAAALNVDAPRRSVPAHALFAADPGHFSPYSPSSRLFYNPLLADAASLFQPDRMAKARTVTGVGVLARELEASSLINWTSSSHAKIGSFALLIRGLCRGRSRGQSCDQASGRLCKIPRGTGSGARRSRVV